MLLHSMLMMIFLFFSFFLYSFFDTIILFIIMVEDVDQCLECFCFIQGLVGEYGCWPVPPPAWNLISSRFALKKTTRFEYFCFLSWLFFLLTFVQEQFYHKGLQWHHWPRNQVWKRNQYNQMIGQRWME